MLKLLKKYELFSILPQIYSQIRQYFPTEAIILQKEYDPEITNSEALVILIKTTLDADKAFNLLKQFDQNYWLDFSFQYKMINVTIDFI